jgi:hypothetical protein
MKSIRQEHVKEEKKKHIVCNRYHLPYHKSDPFYNDTNILFSVQETADPVSLLQEFVCVRDITHGACTPFFLVKMDLNLLAHGLMLNSFLLLTNPLVTTQQELEEPLFMLPLAFPNPSSWP